jgi:hypothetical protein
MFLYERTDFEKHRCSGALAAYWALILLGLGLSWRIELGYGEVELLDAPSEQVV